MARIVCFDAERLMQIVTHHYNYAGSARGKQILVHWAEYLPRFVKVMPVEDRRALQGIEQSQARVAAE